MVVPLEPLPTYFGFLNVIPFLEKPFSGTESLTPMAHSVQVLDLS